MEFTARQIAELVCGEIVGDPEVKVSTFAKIEEGQAGSISFLSNPKYTHHIYTTGASVVLVRRDFQPTSPVKATMIKVEDPYATLSRLLDLASAATSGHPTGIEEPSHIAADTAMPSDAYVGAFSYISENAKIGKGVKIYPQCFVGKGVEIGDGTVIYAGAKIYHGCVIGRNCIIHSGAVIGADGFGFAPLPDGSYHKIPQLGNVIIEDNVEIGANTTVDRATMGSTIIREGAKLDNLIQAAHNTEIGANTVIASQAGIAGSTKIGANCMIGGQAGFAGHITVGKGVQVGAQSGVAHNVADHTRIMGYPAVEARDFMRQSVAIKHLESLMKRVAALEKNKEKEK